MSGRSVIMFPSDIFRLRNRSIVRSETSGFAEKRLAEAAFGRQVSRHLGTEHYERVVTTEKIATIEKLAWHYDEPFADSSALPTYFVSQIAREKVTVAISGDGGDENFAGYTRYLRDVQENRVRRFAPASLRKAVFGPLASIYPKMDWAPRFVRAKTTLQSLSFDPVEGYFETMSMFRSLDKPRILSGDLTRRLGDYDTIDVFREYYCK